MKHVLIYSPDDIRKLVCDDAKKRLGLPPNAVLSLEFDAPEEAAEALYDPAAQPPDPNEDR